LPYKEVKWGVRIKVVPMRGKWGSAKSRETQSVLDCPIARWTKMRSIVWIALLASCVCGRPSLSLLQPLPKHYDAGDASVVFIKHRMNVLPQGFEHNEDGTDLG